MGRAESGNRLNAGVVASRIILFQHHRYRLIQPLLTVLVELCEVLALENGLGLGHACLDLDFDGRIFGMGQDQVLPGVVQVVVVVKIAGSVRVRFVADILPEKNDQLLESSVFLRFVGIPVGEASAQELDHLPLQLILRDDQDHDPPLCDHGGGLFDPVYEFSAVSVVGGIEQEYVERSRVGGIEE